MTRHKFYICGVLALVSMLWLVSVITEWSYQSMIEQALGANEIKSPSLKEDTDLNTIPTSQFDPNLVLGKNTSHSTALNQTNTFPTYPANKTSSPSITSNSTKDKSNNNNKKNFVCHTAPEGSKQHQPILIIANARTGSNLFFSFIKSLAMKQPTEINILHLYEVFGDDDTLLVQILCRIIDQLWRGCGWNSYPLSSSSSSAFSTNLFTTRKFASPDEVFTTALVEFNGTASQQKVIQELQLVFEQRLVEPAKFLQFLHRVPSRSSHPYFVLKVFPYHVIDKLKMTVSNFISLFTTMEQTEYVILWRRNMLEIFVSFQIAAQRHTWTNVGTTEDDAIEVKQSELEWFVQHTTDFYKQARDYLNSNHIHYEEFEYDRDMSDPSHQMDVVQRIQTNLLHQEPDEELGRSIVDHPGTSKQASVPLSQQIVNWENVTSWGYSESPTDWPDLFASSNSPVIKDNNQDNFICDTAPLGAQRHEPILMVANARTGSNLFFSFIKNLASKQESTIDVLNLYEFFGDDMSLVARVLCRIMDEIHRGCGWESDTISLYANRKFSSPEDVFTTALTEWQGHSIQENVLYELQQVISQRLENPANVLRFIHRIPSRLPHAYFALKVFPDQVTRLMKTTISDFISLFSNMNTVYVILWRRNMLEIFVSFQIAKQMKKWTNVGTTEEDAIEVDRLELEKFIQKTTLYYSQAKEYLESHAIPYKEFEYDRDLSDETHHSDVIQRIQTELLHQNATEELIRSVLDPPGLSKQAVVPLSQQIVNWDEVTSWGYSEVSTDWPDLFSQHL